MKKELKHITKLADKLVVNHITNSIEDYNVDLIKKITNNGKNKIHKLKKESRYVLIIGAGASHFTTNKIPLAKEAHEQIKDRIQNGDGLIKRLIDHELKKNNLVYKLDKSDFESQLFAISKYFPNEVIENLASLFKRRYEVSQFYEIVGHLLKHRFIDIVINYNFDEILDNVISEEIKDEEFKIVFSDGECPENYQENVIHKNNRGLKTPVYIKPHGTVSHKSTMRFTREDYYNISYQVNQYIKNLFEGEHNKEEYKYELNLIVVGFGMKSFELNEILKERYNSNKQKINTYIFDYLKPKDYKKSIESEGLNEILKMKFFSCREPNSFDNNFNLLWNKIEGRYKPEYKPKGISRHNFISCILSDKTTLLNSYNSRKQYFKERTYLEIVLLYLLSDGLLNAVQIRKSRVFKYFKLYKNAKGRKRLSSFLADMGIIKYKGYVSDTFYLEEFKLNYSERDLFRFFYKRLLRNIRNKIIQDNIRKNETNILTKYFPTIKKNNLLNVNFSEVYKYHVKFERITDRNLIRNDIHWTYLFRSIFEKEDLWDIILTVSEKGRFLFKERQRDFIKNKRVEIITASLDIGEEEETDLWKEYQTNIVSNEPLKLPWWLHNQHMVIFLKKEQRPTENSLKHNIALKYGFYFNSRLLDRVVSPVYIDDYENLNRMLNIFVSYWHKAIQFKKDKGILNFKCLIEMMDKKNELLDKINESITMPNNR